MALIVDPDLALGVLQTLARFQGTEIDPADRRAARPDPARDALRRRRLALTWRRQHLLRDGGRDATFRHASRRAPRWGLAAEAVDSLLPNAERALEWIDTTETPTGTVTSSTKERPTGASPTRVGRTRGTRIRYADGTVADRTHRALRGAGLRLQRIPCASPLRPRGRRRGDICALQAKGDGP